MNIVCVICSDHLQPSDDIFYTPCGHVFHFACVTQWLERSRTCPQCREKVTQSKIHRIYFNFSNNDTIVEDASSLQATVDTLKFQVLVKEREVKQSNTRNETLKKETAGLRAEVRKLESQLTERETAMYAFKEQLKYFKELSMDAENAKKEVARLKKKLDELRSVQMLMNAPGEEVDEMIRNTQDPSTLITYISVMKRELMTSVTRRKELRGAVKKLQQDLTKVSMERNFLSEEHAHRKQLEEDLAVAESRIKEKNDRIKELEEMIPSSLKMKDVIGRKTDMAEIAKRRQTTSKEADREGNAKSHENLWDVIDIRDVSPIPRRKRPAADVVVVDDGFEVVPPTEKIRSNDENSPYLQFKSSQGHGTDIMKKKVKITTTGPGSYSILAKKPRLAQLDPPVQERRASEMTYDGFGGHSKTDKFPSPKKMSLDAKKSSRGPVRRPKLDDGNNRKLGNRIQSESQATYYPPSLMPEFMGAHPPVNYNNSSYDSGAQGVSYFQNYRNEVLSRFSMPPYEWGVQSTPYSPRPDLVAANRVRNYDRSLTLPGNNITTIDAQRMHEIDHFYKMVQLHREQYRDHTGLLHPLKYFKADEYNFESSPSLLPAYLFKYPETYTAYKLPAVLPLTYERATKSPYLPQLAIPGIYAAGNCIAYKR